ncbi:proton-transporting V-type ATPase complex assembly regulator TMEM9-like isoform X2 [Lineus longissimus]|uniref:proton-transporting V-type ATPase complex assembly regulator TMEM9-like isoform X2 n=1 Tax=Lineus longissimus TaxID=88925 RepID=UPI00315DE2AB
MWSQLLFPLSAFFLVLSFSICTGQEEKPDQNFDDKRCKCTCPSLTVVNETENNRRIYISTVKSEDCKCENVVNPLPKRSKEFCPLCKCKYEIRNTTTIKVVVLIIICIVSLLVVYMLFLLCLDPLMNRRPKTYQEQQNEEENQALMTYISVSGDDQTVTRSTPSTVTGAVGRSRKASNLVNRVKDTQEKWKGTVKEQRKHIYDTHTMLN